MCGIIGYAGKDEAAGIMLDALELLEYRGYENSGKSRGFKEAVQRGKAGRPVRNRSYQVGNPWRRVRCECSSPPVWPRYADT